MGWEREGRRVWRRGKKMLGKTHKPFAMACTAAVLLASHQYMAPESEAFLSQHGAYIPLVSLPLMGILGTRKRVGRAFRKTISPEGRKGKTGQMFLYLAGIIGIGLSVITVPQARSLCLIQIAAWMISMVPDIDRRIEIHRGITHAIWIPVIFAIIAGIFRHQIYVSSAALGACIGWLSHEVGDAFSKAGVDFFYPFGPGYKRYPNGAFYVKGNRGVFVPLYTVGDKKYQYMPMVWWTIYVIEILTLWVVVGWY